MSATYLVTGANRGIGLELARQLAARGDRVVATARRPAEAEELQALGVRVETLDVADTESVSALARRLAGEPLDVLVNNAGRGGGQGSLTEIEPDDLVAYFQVNSLGPLRVTRALLPNLRAGERRLVASLSSQMGSIARNEQGSYYGYRASKAALNMIHRNLALELGGKGFTCVVFHPGWVRTAMGGSSAPLTPEASVRGLLEVMDRLTPQDNGAFLTYAGERLPW